MHYHMQNEEYGKVIEACKRYGDQEGCLWEQALGYFARKEEDCKAYISEVLHHIDQNNLMPPLLGEQLGGACVALCILTTMTTISRQQVAVFNRTDPLFRCSGADAGAQFNRHPLGHQGLPY